MTLNCEPTNKKKIDVSFQFFLEDLDNVSTLMNNNSSPTNDNTKHLNFYSNPITLTDIIFSQDEDAGGETFTFTIYKNNILTSTVVSTSAAADTPKSVSISPSIKIKKNDIIQLRLKSSNATALDEVVSSLVGYYYV